jgi:hypothetical protein
MNSHEKLAAMMEQNRSEGGDSQLGGVLRLIRPFLLSQIPQDPAEFDKLLLMGSQWALDLRSDDAYPPAFIEADFDEEVEGELVDDQELELEEVTGEEG